MLNADPAFRHCLQLAAVALLLAPPALEASAAPPTVGVVADFQPARAQLTLRRQAQVVHLHLGTGVAAGDRLVLDRPGQSVTLQLADGRVLRFDRPGEHPVPEAKPLGRLGTILASIPDLFGDDGGLGGTAVSRDFDRCGMPGFVPEPPRMPSVPEAGARLVAGRLDVSLAWSGGCAPFALELRRDGAAMLAEAGLARRQASLRGVALAPGRYELVVVDGGGVRAAFGLEVLATAPELPAELRGARSDLGRIATAVWFTQQDEGRWVLEGVRRLDALAQRGDPLASSLQQAWLTGQPLR